MTAVSNSAGSFANDPLSKKRIDTGDNGAAVRCQVINVDIDGFVFVENIDVIVDAHHSEDEIESHGEQRYKSELSPSDTDR